MNQYEDRYVAFVDVLGFKDLVYRSEEDAELLTKIVSVLEEVKNYDGLSQAMDDSGGDFFDGMFKITTFSDCILISTKPNPIGLTLIMSICGFISSRLLDMGVFTRGALSKGKLIHKDQIVLGEGLIKAYKLESEVAVFPRILIDEGILDAIKLLEAGSGTLFSIRHDFDGLWHLHILSNIALEILCSQKKDRSTVMESGRREIENVLKNTTDPAIKSKIRWLANYFNSYSRELGLPRVEVGSSVS